MDNYGHTSCLALLIVQMVWLTGSYMIDPTNNRIANELSLNMYVYVYGTTIMED